MATEVDAFWDASEPFADQDRSPPSKPRKKSSGKETEIVLPDAEIDAPANELGELIDGSEDDITALEEQADEAALVGADVVPDDRVPAAGFRAAAKRSVQMAEKKTKAEAIREEIARRKTAGEETIRPRDVIAALAEQGIEVTAPQVSVTLRDWGKTPAEKAARAPKAEKPTRVAANSPAADRPAKRATARVTANAPKPAPAANRPPYEALEAAAAFVQAHGGVEQAKNLLDAYARLFNPAG